MYFFSTESGWDNPFRPGGDLSKEADEIVELIKGGKPITPTPDGSLPPLPSLDQADSPANQKNAVSESHQKTSANAQNVAGSPKSSANGNVQQNEKPAAPGAVEVQRGTAVQPGDASQVEHVTIKKKPKCKCCVIQ